MPETASSPPLRPNEANARAYSQFVLRWVYTWFVIFFSHRFAWRIPNRVLHANHRRGVGAVHVSVGPGNGHFLAKLPRRAWPRLLHLLDLNPACLALTGRRLGSRFTVRAHEQDALARWPLGEASVDSVDCHMMLHTVRGTDLRAKAALVAEAARVLRPGGVFFGCTILARGEGVRVNGLARRLMALYNGQSNTFCNLGDTAEDLREVLIEHFGADQVRVRVMGCVGVWVAAR